MLNTPLTAFPLQLFLRALAAHPEVQATITAVAKTDYLSGIYLLLGIGILFIIAALVKIPDIAVPPLTLFADLFFVIALFAGFGWTGYWLLRQGSRQEQSQQEVART